MQVSNILATDGGPHAPETWALGTARHLMPRGSFISGARELEAQKLETKIAELLVPHHGAGQEAERAALADKGEARLGAPHDHDAAAIAAVEAIVAAAKGTPWEAQFASLDWQAVASAEIAGHFATAAREEREWWAHRNALTSDGARAYLAPKYAPRPPAPAAPSADA